MRYGNLKAIFLSLLIGYLLNPKLECIYSHLDLIFSRVKFFYRNDNGVFQSQISELKDLNIKDGKCILRFENESTGILCNPPLTTELYSIMLENLGGDIPFITDMNIESLDDISLDHILPMGHFLFDNLLQREFAPLVQFSLWLKKHGFRKEKSTYYFIYDGERVNFKTWRKSNPNNKLINEFNEHISKCETSLFTEKGLNLFFSLRLMERSLNSS